MFRAIVLRTALWTGVMGLVLLISGALAPESLLASAEGAGKAGARARAYERKVLRHKEHALLRAERHHLREAAREKRQVSYLKRVLSHHK